MQVRVYLSLNH